MAKEYGYLTNGEWRKSNRKKEIRNPYSGEVVAIINVPSDEEAMEALKGSHEAFKKTRDSHSYERSEALRKVADGLRAKKEEMARALAEEAGKPIRTSRIEIDRAITTFTVASEEAKRLSGETLTIDIVPGNEGKWGLVKRFPIGVVLGISPWNFPLNLVAHKVGPAIASGNTIVLKPASQTPVSALKLGEIVTGAGWVPGGLNIIPVPGSKIESLMQDQRVKKISFTGSPEVGWRLMEKYPRKKLTLELGGNAASIIDEDPPDLEFAVNRNVLGSFSQAGQSCISIQRIYVHKKLFNKFTDMFVERTKTLKVGDPLLEETDVGPVIDDESADRIMNWIDEAVEMGAKILTGGNRDGRLIEPTVLTNVPHNARASCQEIFGPVVHIEKVSDFYEGIEKTNDSLYGINAGVFTRDMKKIMDAYRLLEVGGVIVNDYPTFRVENMPYGGVKESGIGREGVRYAIEEMTELKLMVLSLANWKV